MGYYINGIGTSYQEKISNLVEKHQAEVIEKPLEWKENLVCVVNNGMFGAAAWMNDDREFQQWLSNDGRDKIWLIVPNAMTLAK